MNKDTKYCWQCNTEKPLSEFGIHKSGKQAGKPLHPCRKCKTLKTIEWNKANPEKVKASRIKYNQNHPDRNGHNPISETPTCPLYLGYYISETILSHEFKNVTRMPPNHPGYDFICSKNKKIDAKSSCIVKPSRGGSYWQFTIRCNPVPDYFLCLAFDNRDDLNPVHVWLFPAKLLNTKKLFYIGNSTQSLAKWSKYERPLTGIIDCCNAFKSLKKDEEEVIKL